MEGGFNYFWLVIRRIGYEHSPFVLRTPIEGHHWSPAFAGETFRTGLVDLVVLTVRNGIQEDTSQFMSSITDSLTEFSGYPEEIPRLHAETVYDV